MYYKFGDSTLGVGFIKQLLHSVDLPRCEVFTSMKNCIVGKFYIKDRHIAKCVRKYDIADASGSYVNCDFTYLDHYSDEQTYLNFTERFDIHSTVYDTETHEWLGNYLRFVRDYYGENLMPLYNCYSNHYISNLSLDIKINDAETHVFNAHNDEYDYVAIPVKLNKQYTIAIECPAKYEMCCAFYDSRLNKKLSAQIAPLTYKQLNSSGFYHPYLYSTELSDTDIAKFKPLERYLKLIVKLPKKLNSSIVVLEGDFREGSSRLISDIPGVSTRDARTINNVRQTIDGSSFVSYQYVGLGTKLSLLHQNDGISYPFADKLLTYLLKFAIDAREEISNNVLEVKDLIFIDGKNQGNHEWDVSIHDRIITIIREAFKKNQSSVVNRFCEDTFDNLYYVDCDVEKMLNTLGGRR